MLEMAYLYKECLQKEYTKAILKSDNKFYNCSRYYKFGLEIKENSYDDLQFVSISKEKDEYRINGYFCANLYHETNSVSGVQAIRFNNSITFSFDLYKFLMNLFDEYNFRKIVWFVIIGNSSEKMYDKIVTKWGGRIVGIFKEHVKLFDGKLYDQKYYEIFKSDYDYRKRSEK